MVKPAKRKGTAEWASLIAAQKESTMTIQAFCEAHQIKPHNFYYWRNKLSKREDQSAGFIALHPSPCSGGLLVLRYGREWELELPIDYPSSALIALLKGLQC